MAMRALSRVAALSLASAELLLTSWQNAALAPASSGAKSTVTCVNISESGGPAFTSMRFEGLLTSPWNSTLNFTMLSEGGVRLWISDHLVIDQGGQHGSKPVVAQPFLPIPFLAELPQAIRLEYTHWDAPVSVVKLMWGNSSGGAATLVPPEALTPIVSAAEQQRQLVRDRLLAPSVPWQTYYNPSMAAHMHMPSGVIVDATLANSETGEIIGPIYVFRQFNPAAVRLGLHSANGSDYTEFHLAAWHWSDCNVTLQTTVVGEGEGAQLQFLASANGTQCGPLLLVVSPKIATERYGNCSSMGSGSSSFVCGAPGFSPVQVQPIGAAPVAFPQANLSVYFALPLVEHGATSGAVGYVAGSGGAPVPAVAAIQANIASARSTLHASAVSRFGPNGWEIAEAIHSIIVWNTVFTPIDGVVTPVGRTWDFGSGYALFDWDNLFLAYTASFLSTSTDTDDDDDDGGRLRDIAYSNLIQTVMGRTLAGFVPNWASGSHVSFDRSEPQIGAQVLLRIYNRTGDAWLIDLLLDPLLGWAEWVWTHRRGEGVLASGSPDGQADVIVLGSDVANPPGDGTSNTLQGARYESGLDNSPMYDGPPVTFNNVTGHMELYDVGMTGLFLAELRALITLAEVAGRSDVIPLLQQRYDRVFTALNTHLWDPHAGMYTNVLYNGSFYARYSPTSYFPLIASAASDQQVAAAIRFMTSPAGFCLNSSFTPHPNASLLVQWYNHGYSKKPGAGDSAACGTDSCSADQVHEWYDWIRLEAAVLSPDSQPIASMLPLNRFYSAARADTALTTNATGPDGTYVFVQQEGWCFTSSSSGGGGGGAPLTPLTLHLLSNGTTFDYLTCGTAECRIAAGANGYVLVQQLCFAWDASTPETAPCLVGGTSIARSDAGFYDQAYWRGRLWGPHVQLQYWALQAYDHLPEARFARQQLAQQSSSVLLRNWRTFGWVSEHYNGLLGLYDWTYQLDPAYHWGSCLGVVALLEQRL